jgi:hypothetical protein
MPAGLHAYFGASAGAEEGLAVLSFWRDHEVSMTRAG